MPYSPRIFNVDRQHNISLKYALRGIENCAFAWVEQGVSVRNLTPFEQRTALSEQARLREPLEYAELPGIIFRPPIGAEKTNIASGVLVWEAHRFARESAA